MKEGQEEFIVSFLEEIEQVTSLYETVMNDLEGDQTPEVGRALAITHTKLEEAELWAAKALVLANDAIERTKSGGDHHEQ